MEEYAWDMSIFIFIYFVSVINLPISGGRNNSLVHTQNERSYDVAPAPMCLHNVSLMMRIGQMVEYRANGRLIQLNA